MQGFAAAILDQLGAVMHHTFTLLSKEVEPLDRISIMVQGPAASRRT